MILEQSESSTKIEQLRNRINDKDYLASAIQRIALVLSNELMEITTVRRHNERQRKKRR
jgi:hypothetical protein